ncbi:hypothetical protein GOODEAATRI_013200 [Goodea atripinnis]|uniref:Uncharacterized protein n=1 Tax=Goodea atripinnis TaxID=208336 RepID=A0ABV0NK40_9TELE
MLGMSIRVDLAEIWSLFFLVTGPVQLFQGNCVFVGVTKVTVKNASREPVGGLEGNTTFLFNSCRANFRDLSILNSENGIQ